MGPWQGWFHVTVHTYGSWLRGDPRGWRSRSHRDHVEGDYRNSPSVRRYGALYARSKALMKRQAVRIEGRDAAEFVLRTLMYRLREFGAPVAAGSFDGVHGHLLVRCSKGNPRIVVGIAKQYSSAQFKAYGLAVGLGLARDEGIWGKRSYAKPIADKAHFDTALKYICAHARLGAIVLIPKLARAVKGREVKATMSRKRKPTA